MSFLLDIVLVMLCPVTLPLFHPMPPAAPLHQGCLRQHDWADGTSKGATYGHGRTRCRCSSSGPALSAAVTGSRSWDRICVAACVLYSLWAPEQPTLEWPSNE